MTVNDVPFTALRTRASSDGGGASSSVLRSSRRQLWASAVLACVIVGLIILTATQLRGPNAAELKLVIPNTSSASASADAPALAAPALAEHQVGLLKLALSSADLPSTDWYSAYSPVTVCPSKWPLTRYGSSGDGGKLMCSLEGLAAPCTVLSFGSNGDFSFETDILKRTPCHVHTFDCTYDGESIDDRHTYHKRCIDGVTWAQVIEGELGLRSVDVLKVDIEGGEFDLLASWGRAGGVLPRQLSIEFHRSLDAAGAFKQHAVEAHLVALGYASYSLEHNPTGGGCCAEVSYLHLG